MNKRFRLTLLAAAFAGVTACGADSAPELPSDGSPVETPAPGTDNPTSPGTGSDGGNTDGGNTDGGNTDGGNTDGGNTDGGDTDGGGDEPAPTPTPTPDPEPSQPAPGGDVSCTTDCDFEGLSSSKSRVSIPSLSVPRLHQTWTDPVFGTPVTRASAPSQISGASRVRHVYSKQDPWNADGSYLLLEASSGHVWLYDGNSYNPIRQLTGKGTVDNSDAEIQWHPTDPNVFYFMDRDSSGRFNQFARYEVSSGTAKTLYNFADLGYIEARGRGEGNLSNDGRYYSVLGRTASGKHEVAIYDIHNDRISGRADVTSIHNNHRIDWVGVSQSGKYVAALASDTTHIYDTQGNRLGSLPRGSLGHGDMCMTADGRDVFVYDGADYVASGDGDRWINMAYLDTVKGNNTGKTVAINRISWPTTPHVSCRNIKFPGWALVSNQTGDSNFDMEVYWVKLDGSNEVRRVAHHHSSRSAGGYYGEQHATTNRLGTKVMFASNIDGKDSISSYVVDLTNYRRPLVR